MSNISTIRPNITHMAKLKKARKADRLWSHLQAIGDDMKNQHADPVRVAAAMRSLYDLCTAEAILDPSEYFDFIAGGGYKACYDFIPGWVIKFTYNDNILAEERMVYEAGISCRMRTLFPKTYYVANDVIAISAAVMLETGAVEEERWSDSANAWVCNTAEDIPPFDAFVIQKKIDMTVEKLFDTWEVQVEDEKTAALAAIGEVTFTKMGTAIKVVTDDSPDKMWEADVAAAYGEEFMEKTYRPFVERWGIVDLHGGNLGYNGIENGPYNLVPQIIDWMSNPSTGWMDEDAEEDMDEGGNEE